MKRTGKVKIAQKDIIVWKVFVKMDESILTPYRNVSKSGLFRLRDNLRFDDGYGIHTYKRKKDALLLISKWSHFYPGIVVKCFIPAGSSYVEGFDTTSRHTMNLPCYQSTRLKEFK